MNSGTVVLLVAVLQVGPVPQEPSVPPSIVSAEVRAVEATADGSLWFAVRERGLARLTAGEVTWFDEDDGLMSNGVADLHEDRAGRLWAVGVGGFSVFANGRWDTHRGFAGLEPRVIFGVHEDVRTGAIWLASSSGAGRLEDGGWTVVRESDGLPHAVVHSVAVDPDGQVWLACRTGLARIAHGEVGILLLDVNVRSALVGPGGVLWFGTSDGVYEWSGSSWSRHLSGKTVYPRLVTDDGVVWAGSAGAGVFRNAGDGWDPVEVPERLDGAEVFDLAAGPDGAIWLATAAGVGRLEGIR